MATTPTSLDDMIATPEAGVELGITATRVLILIKEGRLPAKKIGKVWIMRRGDLDLVRDRPVGRPRNRDRDDGKKPAAKKPATKKKRS